MWGLLFLAAAGVGAILLAYSMGRSAGFYDAVEEEVTRRRHPSLRWEPCGRCDLAWSTPTACGFAGCVDGFVPREVDDDAV